MDTQIAITETAAGEPPEGPPFPEPERVVTELDGRTFPVTALVAEGGGDWFEFSNPVRVKSSDDRLIGFANLRLEGQRLYADAAIDYSTPERLSIEAGGDPLWAYVVPHASGRTTEGKFVVEFVRVSMTRPASGRPPLRAP